ncbi:MAG: nuclear transport factor 2 family protein [Gammaproteobacteria bacterium]|nr:nuclear transport factor 2 family protein [Gammaproteobacteria bacterium]
MTDHDEIRNLFATYAHLFDDGRYEEWANLFRYGAFTFLGRRLSGPQEILDFMLPISVGKSVLHVNFNIALHVDEDVATARSDVVTAVGDASGVLKLDHVQGARARYDDVLRRIDGRWWFIERVITLRSEAVSVAAWSLLPIGAR